MTLEQLEAAAALMRDLPPEPLGEWMRSQGHPPEQWTLVLPDSLRQGFSVTFPPSYVRFTPFIEIPVFIRRAVMPP